jgi:hypothetical protein
MKGYKMNGKELRKAVRNAKTVYVFSAVIEEYIEVKKGDFYSCLLKSSLDFEFDGVDLRGDELFIG